MELRQLRYFVQVADFKSFSRAATAVRVAQPALSRHIRKLEQEIGVSLFYRDGRGAILTEEGERYYQKVSAVLRQLDEAAAELRTDHEEPAGEVHLGVPTQLGSQFVLQLVRLARRRYPNARLRVADGCNFQIVEWLQSSRIDAGFIYDPKDYRNLPAKIVVEESLYLVGPAADRYTAQDVVAFPLIVYLPLILPNLGRALRRQIAESVGHRALLDNCDTSIDSLPAIKQLVMAGSGYTILPYAAVYEETMRGELTAVRIVEPELTRPLAFALRPNGALSATAIKLANLIQQELHELLAKGHWRGHAVDKNGFGRNRPTVSHAANVVSRPQASIFRQLSGSA